MEQNLPIITKKLCKMVKLAFFMLRKGFSKKKILLDLSLMMERGKMAFTGKVSSSRGLVTLGCDPFREYEFSCNNTPLYRHYFTCKKKNQQSCYYYYLPSPKFEDSGNFEAINKALETMLSCKDSGVRQLRTTDSSFHLQNEEEFGDQRVDEAAEEFIKRFYSLLKEQSC